MIYFILGEDGARKDLKISELKNRISSPESLSFDYDVFYGYDLSLSALKKSLLALPAIASQRLILIHACHKLSSHHLAMIHDFACSGQRHAVLILESSEWKADHAFVRKLGSKAKTVEFHSPKPKNVFDMTRIMAMRQPTEALQVLTELFGQGIHPLQILGGLVWFWAQQKPRLGQDKYVRGLRTLQETDFNIKRSRLDPAQAMEVAVVKLCGIL